MRHLRVQHFGALTQDARGVLRVLVRIDPHHVEVGIRRTLGNRAGAARGADRFLTVVQKVAAAEQRALANSALDGATSLAEAVARGLYKLLAYKDEYEVARLHLDAAERERISDIAGDGAMKVRVQLHPPVLRAMGMNRKISLGPLSTPAFGALRAMKRLRGTPLDVFGYAHVRVVERELIEEYLETVERVLGALSGATHPVAVQLADLPDMVRGYEEVKMGNVERYRARRAELLAELEGKA